MPRNIVIARGTGPAADELEVEMCEHKGTGHPDTIADAVCEAASRELSRAYLDAFGRVSHYNLDKGLLIGGQSVPKFGGGAVIEPMKLVICGRASALRGDVGVEEVVRGAVERNLRERLHCDSKHFRIATEIRSGAPSLQRVIPEGGEPALANDTSIGVGFAPYSRLERLVLTMSRVLASEEFRARFPAAGDDFKIMGLRNGRRAAPHLTVALALVDRHIDGADHYFAVKDAIRDHLRESVNGEAEIVVNALDNRLAADESEVYLTVTGLSAEMGDDGQVGRGNRVNGLITPNRSMSLEAAAGKNPVSHVGKIYNVLAMLIARDVHSGIEGITEVTVQLLSEIGRRIDDPLVAAVVVKPGKNMTARLRRQVMKVTDDWLGDVSEVSRSVLNGDFRVC